MNIPLSASTGILVSGASPAAIKIALEARAAGAEVSVITSFNYCGEDSCATLDFWNHNTPMFAELFPGWPEQIPVPTQIKLALENKLLEAKIPFLYGTHLLRLMRDGQGNFAGVLLGNRSGLQIVRAGLIIDGSGRALAARQTRMPFATFTPGKKLFERVILSPEPSIGPGEALPVPFAIKDMIIHAKLYRAELEMRGTGPEDFATAELEMRRRSWHPETLGGADQCRCLLEDKPIGTDPEKFVFLPDQLSAHEAAAIAAKRQAGIPSQLEKLHHQQPASSAKLLFSPDFRHRNADTVNVPTGEWPLLTSCDTAVAGGGTGGVPAGIAAARHGANTVIIESQAHLGGVGTEGRIAAYWFGNRNGFTREVDMGVDGFGGSIEPGGRKWKVESKQQYWEHTALTAGCRVYLQHSILAVTMDSGRVGLLLVAGPHGNGLIGVKNVVDATGNADVAAAAGAPTEYSDPNEPALQGTGLPPIIPGVSSYNTDYTFSVDSDSDDITRTLISGRRLFSSEFDLGRLINTRERRRISANLQLMPQDFYLQRTYRDTINIASSNFDTHGFTVHPLFTIRPPHHDPISARVPYRALLPRELDNVIVTGLGMSAHRDALPVIRMQADVQNQGFAAGIAAAMTAANQQAFNQIDIHALQNRLVELGLLPESELNAIDAIPHPDSDPMAAAFAMPTSAMPRLLEKYRETPDIETAMLLAFLGNDSGKELLLRNLEQATWDRGWPYTGMHQFGASCSRLDAVIMALAALTGIDAAPIIRLAGQLTPDHEFSHFRACSLFLRSNPAADAIPVLEHLLNMPEMTGWTVNSQRQAAEHRLTDKIDTIERNRQLKEIYTATALISCSTQHHKAMEILRKYAGGLHGLFARHAAKFLEPSEPRRNKS